MNDFENYGGGRRPPIISMMARRTKRFVSAMATSSGGSEPTAINVSSSMSPYSSASEPKSVQSKKSLGLSSELITRSTNRRPSLLISAFLSSCVCGVPRQKLRRPTCASTTSNSGVDRRESPEPEPRAERAMNSSVAIASRSTAGYMRCVRADHGPAAATHARHSKAGCSRLLPLKRIRRSDAELSTAATTPCITSPVNRLAPMSSSSSLEAGTRARRSSTSSSIILLSHNERTRRRQSGETTAALKVGRP
eukprot:Amastigsp_a339731_29.p3 type:complete len:251 gc:universal Amastigsp_a339731_29:138-890(+)